LHENELAKNHSCASVGIEAEAFDGIAIRDTSFKQQVMVSAGQEGNYQVWAYYQGAVSDTIDVAVRMAGPTNCRTLATQKVTFTLRQNLGMTSSLKLLGGCGQ
jgi:hypothetical protein